jgi:hypothetical protein
MLILGLLGDRQDVPWSGRIRIAAGAGHVALAERDRARRPHDAVVLIVGRAIGGQLESVTDLQDDVAGELALALVLSSDRLIGGDDVRAPVGFA